MKEEAITDAKKKLTWYQIRRNQLLLHNRDLRATIKNNNKVTARMSQQIEELKAQIERHSEPYGLTVSYSVNLQSWYSTKS